MKAMTKGYGSGITGIVKGGAVLGTICAIGFGVFKAIEATATKAAGYVKDQYDAMKAKSGA